jgi:uncharacterized Zn finger protein
MQNKLTHCPFCNGTAEFVIYTHNETSNGVAARCATCGAEAQRQYYDHHKVPLQEIIKRVEKCQAKAAELWNKRYELKRDD